MTCYHVTTHDRLASILAQGLLPNSPPTWFTSPAPYVLVYKIAWAGLNGDASVGLAVDDPSIKESYFDDPAGLRWPYRIEPQYLSVVE